MIAVWNCYTDSPDFQKKNIKIWSKNIGFRSQNSCTKSKLLLLSFLIKIKTFLISPLNLLIHSGSTSSSISRYQADISTATDLNAPTGEYREEGHHTPSNWSSLRGEEAFLATPLLSHDLWPCPYPFDARLIPGFSRSLPGMPGMLDHIVRASFLMVFQIEE